MRVTVMSLSHQPIMRYSFQMGQPAKRYSRVSSTGGNIIKLPDGFSMDCERTGHHLCDRAGAPYYQQSECSRILYTTGFYCSAHTGYGLLFPDHRCHFEHRAHLVETLLEPSTTYTLHASSAGRTGICHRTGLLESIRLPLLIGEMIRCILHERDQREWRWSLSCRIQRILQ
jgi:hypothetical protein